MKWAARILAFLAFALLAAAGVAYSLKGTGPNGPAPPFAVGRTEFMLADIEPGQHELVLPITNPAKIPRQIIGLSEA